MTGHIENLHLNEECDEISMATDATTYLPYPETITFNDSEELKTFHFWNDSDAIYAVAKNSENITLTGYYNTIKEYDSAWDTMSDLDWMTDNGEEITISGIGNDDIDTTWVIEEYSYSPETGSPSMVRWNITLEKT
jgi:hypothetical protein